MKREEIIDICEGHGMSKTTNFDKTPNRIDYKKGEVMISLSHYFPHDQDLFVGYEKDGKKQTHFFRTDGLHINLFKALLTGAL